jgi:hypothetical protein
MKPAPAAKPVEELNTNNPQPSVEPTNGRPSIEPPPPQRQGKLDPLANVLEREQQRPGFNYTSEPDLKKLI